MQKHNFHNISFINEDLKTNNTKFRNINHNVSVDVNKLLNRVKIKKKNENKKKVAFISFGILLLGFMGIFVTIIK